MRGGKHHFYFSLPMPSMRLNTKLVMTTHRPILHRKSPGMVKMCKGHTTMLTQLELLLLSPTRQDLRGTLRIERCRKEQCRSRRETFLNLGLDLLLESLHHHLHHLGLHHLGPHPPACPSQILLHRSSKQSSLRSAVQCSRPLDQGQQLQQVLPVCPQEICKPALGVDSTRNPT